MKLQRKNHFKGYLANLQTPSVVYKSKNSNDKMIQIPQYGRHYVISQIFLEVVRKGKKPEVTTNQPSDTESSQSVSRQALSLKFSFVLRKYQASYKSKGFV